MKLVPSEAETGGFNKFRKYYKSSKQLISMHMNKD